MEELHFEFTNEVDFEMFDFEIELEPLARTRSNTWPVPQPEHFTDTNVLTDNSSTVGSTEHIKTGCSAKKSTAGKTIEGSTRKKKPSRQNPWGDYSYAELITLAINSSKDRRLTLSQIYDWMVQNVPFFKNKSESKSSAGWKNSVRHNLSLHNCFIRVPNENQGRSSWWTINPDAKSSKTSRRRAASMEAGKLEKKRTLANKQTDSLRKKILKNECLTASSGSIDSAVQSTLINKHWQEHFRPRASSCASTMGNWSVIPQIPEEPIWKASEYQLPVAPPPVQHVIPPPMQPIIQAYSIQEYQQILNNQIFIAPQNFTAVSGVCLIHPVGGCNCNNRVAINNEIPNAIGSDQDNFTVITESDISDLIDSVCTNTVEMTEAALVQDREESVTDYDYYEFVDAVDQATNAQVVTRHNSMLDDIEEIITKEEKLEQVNTSISETLFISNNNNLIRY